MFKRYHKQLHYVEQNEVLVSFDRLKGLLQLFINGQLVVERQLWFTPYVRATFCYQERQYQLKVLAFMLWRSELSDGQDTIIKELLPSRRRQSIGHLVTFYLLRMAKIFG